MLLSSFPTTELWAIVRSPTWCLPPSKRQTGRPNQIPRPSLSTSVANWHLWKPRSQAPGGAERREASWRNIQVLGKTWTISQWPSNWIGPEELPSHKRCTIDYCIPSKSGITWQDSEQSTASSKHAESSLVATNFVTLSPHGSNLCSNLMLKNVIARELKGEPKGSQIQPSWGKSLESEMTDFDCHFCQQIYELMSYVSFQSPDLLHCFRHEIVSTAAWSKNEFECSEIKAEQLAKKKYFRCGSDQTHMFPCAPSTHLSPKKTVKSLVSESSIEGSAENHTKLKQTVSFLMVPSNRKKMWGW